MACGRDAVEGAVASSDDNAAKKKNISPERQTQCTMLKYDTPQSPHTGVSRAVSTRRGRAPKAMRVRTRTTVFLPPLPRRPLHTATVAFTHRTHIGSVGRHKFRLLLSAFLLSLSCSPCHTRHPLSVVPDRSAAHVQKYRSHDCTQRKQLLTDRSPTSGNKRCTFPAQPDDADERRSLPQTVPDVHASHIPAYHFVAFF